MSGCYHQFGLCRGNVHRERWDGLDHRAMPLPTISDEQLERAIAGAIKSFRDAHGDELTDERCFSLAKRIAGQVRAVWLTKETR